MSAARAVYLCDGVRTPFGRIAAACRCVRTDDLAALPLRHCSAAIRALDPAAVDEVILGCANQAGEDNRNVARMAALLAGCRCGPGVHGQRLCASGWKPWARRARAIALGDADLVLAGASRSMSRAPYVLAKADAPFSRDRRSRTPRWAGAS
jgi:3-oxoadipyl-CoA thiolase